MGTHNTISDSRPNSEAKEVLRSLQNKLATRLLLAFLVPLVAIVVLGVYAYQISSRIEELERLERVTRTETYLRIAKNYRLALKEYEDLSQTYSDSEIYFRLAGLYYKTGEAGKALQTLETAKGLPGPKWRVYQTLAFIHAMEKREKQAIEAGETALGLNPLDAQTYNNLAWVFATSKNDEIRDVTKAKQYADKAVHLTLGQQIAYLDTLAQVYVETNDFTRALDTVEKAIRVSRKDLYILLQRKEDMLSRGKGINK